MGQNKCRGGAILALLGVVALIAGCASSSPGSAGTNSTAGAPSVVAVSATPVATDSQPAATTPAQDVPHTVEGIARVAGCTQTATFSSAETDLYGASAMARCIVPGYGEVYIFKFSSPGELSQWLTSQAYSNYQDAGGHLVKGTDWVYVDSAFSDGGAKHVAEQMRVGDQAVQNI